MSGSKSQNTNNVQGENQRTSFFNKNQKWIIIAAIAIFILLFLCMLILLASGSLFFILPGSSSTVRITDSAERILSHSGGEVSLGALTVDVPPGVILDEALLQIGEVGKRSLPDQLPKHVQLIGDVYALEWGQGAALTTDPVSVTFTYDPKDLPKDADPSELAIITYDGQEWLRIPAEIDPDEHTVSADVSHFCLKALVRYTLTGFSQREVADRTQADIDVSGQVEYTLSDYPGDHAARAVPAGNLRFALLDTDGIVLHDGQLETDGSFEFTLPAGTDVAIDLDAQIRIYADDYQSGRVLNRVPPNGGPWWYSSEVQSVSLSSDRMDFFTITIPEEHSGAFNILHALQDGRAFTPGFKADPVTVIWAGTGRGPDVETRYDEELDVIFLSKDPQTAWDEDLVLRMYGEYIHHWLLLDNSSLFCSGSPKGPQNKSNACQAWVEGFGFFFSAAVRGDEYYEIYRHREGVESSFNLENGDIAYGPRSSGTVSQILWDMIDERSDGESISVDISSIFDLLYEFNTSIDSISAFYDFWSIERTTSRGLCQLFADYEIVNMDMCASLKDTPKPLDDQEKGTPEDSPTAVQLNYGDGTMGSLNTYEEDLYRFSGSQDDQVVITIQPLDDGLELDLALSDADDNFLAFGQGSISRLSIDPYTLPANGEYFISVAAVAGEGDYTISLNRRVYDNTRPSPNTATPTLTQTTTTTTTTRTATQAPTRTATITSTLTPTGKPSATPTATLQGGPSGGTIQFTIIVPEYNQRISSIYIGMPVNNWDDVSDATIGSGTQIFDQYNDPIKPGEQRTIEAPAGVWSITAWSRAMSGESLYDAEMLIDMRQDTEWVIEDHPKWD